MRRPTIDAGLISIARTQRGSVRPRSVTGRNHLSCVCAASVYGGDVTTRSGLPYNFANSQPVGSAGGAVFGARSAALPSGVPASTQREIVSICASDKLRSFLKCWIPTDLSMYHGGMSRALTRDLIDRAYFLASANVCSDIGPIEFG